MVFRVNITNLTRLSIQNDHTGEIGNRELEQGKIKKSNLQVAEIEAENCVAEQENFVVGCSPVSATVATCHA